MPVRYADVRDALLYEYAKLIADAAVHGRPDRAPVVRAGRGYWAFVTRTFQRLRNGQLSPSAVLRENQLLVSQGRECAYCGAVGTLAWEHLIPRARGGPDTIDNLVLACPPCNARKGARNPIEWYERQGRDRSEIPRLVMGKLLKLVLEEHQRRGTLGQPEFPPGQALTTAGACRVFDFLPAPCR